MLYSIDHRTNTEQNNKETLGANGLKRTTDLVLAVDDDDDDGGGDDDDDDDDRHHLIIMKNTNHS
jgi:hypothetical protein